MKVGDNVRFLNEAGEAVVKKIISPLKVIVEIEGGMEIEYAVNELVPVSPISLKDIRVFAKEPVVRKSSPVRSIPHAEDEMVVDLHIDSLREDAYTLTNYEMLDIQISHFRKKLKLAAFGHFTKIIFIHGVGNGVLRQTVRDMLNRYEGISYSDAPYNKFGAGATQVRIISKNKIRASL